MGQNTLSKLLEPHAAFANVQSLSITEAFRKHASRGGIVLGLAHMKLRAAFPHFPAPDRPTSLLRKTAGAEGPNTAASQHGNGEIPVLWSEHLPARIEISERPAELQRCQANIYVYESRTQRITWQGLRPENKQA